MPLKKIMSTVSANGKTQHRKSKARLPAKYASDDMPWTRLAWYTWRCSSSATGMAQFATSCTTEMTRYRPTWTKLYVVSLLSEVSELGSVGRGVECSAGAKA